MARIDPLFKEMGATGASDLHMVAGRPPMLRLRGDLVATKHKSLSHEINEKLFGEILTRQQMDQLRTTYELDCSLNVPGIARFRCNFFYQQRGISGVFRFIPNEIIPLDKLGMPAGVQKILDIERGLIVVVGPTGCGKSTTLASMIDRINRTKERHIITIEDPLEFIHENHMSLVTQREVGSSATSFADALRVASREDPDIILVGELRDLETVQLALQCAELGILVYGTLHTNSAIQTIDRIINSFPSSQQNQIRAMLSESLRAVVAQELLKTADGKGRCAAVEILTSSGAVSNLIREGKLSQVESIMQTGTGEGMQVLDQALMKLVDEGRISPETAYWKAKDKAIFASKCSGELME